MNTKEKIEVMQAYLDGTIIQKYNNLQNRWIDWDKTQAGEMQPRWNWADHKYRIKPEPIEVLAWYCRNDWMRFVTDDDIKQLDTRRWPAGWRLVKLREVEEKLIWKKD